METVIQTQGFGLTPSLEKFTRSRVKKALGKCADNIERVVVRLKDINGPKGGPDKHCSVEIIISRSPILIISNVSSDMYHSIQHTTKKAARTALRHLDRRRVQKLKSKKGSNNLLEP